MLRFPAPQKFNTFNTFNTFAIFAKFDPALEHPTRTPVTRRVSDPSQSAVSTSHPPLPAHWVRERTGRRG